MKRVLLSIVVLITSCILFFGCTKNRPYVTSINPTMTADVGSFKFIASSVRQATIDTQIVDTSTTLEITGYSSDRVSPYDKIRLYIANYKGVTGVYSIVQGQAGAIYNHGVLTGTALGGVVAITSVTSNSIVGYFSFNTDDGIAVTNGKYTVGTP